MRNPDSQTENPLVNPAQRLHSLPQEETWLFEQIQPAAVTLDELTCIPRKGPFRHIKHPYAPVETWAWRFGKTLHTHAREEENILPAAERTTVARLQEQPLAVPFGQTNSQQVSNWEYPI